MSVAVKRGYKRPKKKYREIVVDGTVYHYKVGKHSIDIRSDVFRASPSISAVLGIPQHDVERGREKKTLVIGPGDISQWIREKRRSK